MGNIMDYLAWRGDLPFELVPFCEVDALVLSFLSYVNFRDILSEEDQKTKVPLKEASRLFFEKYSVEEIMAPVLSIKMAAFVMKKMVETKRFGDLYLSHYIDRVDEEQEKQFAAVTIHLPDGTCYVSFRGTDDSVVGWKEDFNMSFKTPVPAQEEAVVYLEKAAAYTSGPLIAGGHSKGGNLAVYASVYADISVQNRIVKVYNHDGPGFHDDMLKKKEYKRIRQRITTIIPESSVVGMLLEHEEEYKVVKSTANGLLQHDALSWEVEGPDFIYVQERSKESRIVDHTIHSWIYHMEPKQREEFVDALFGILKESEVVSLNDLNESKWKKITEVLRVMGNMAPETKEILFGTVKQLFHEANQAVRDAVKECRRIVPPEVQSEIFTSGSFNDKI
ncbi:MAG: DUF2974 domain-containing protein [Clostridiales bacterium]|nr:DUF2974 domain-containing protein [Clostridiales bacterium]